MEFSFKALGGAYAVACVLSAELSRRGAALAATTAELFAGRYVEDTRSITVACATDGNHGRSVAWGAQRFGAGCAIFVHAGVSESRIDAIARYGAAIHVVPGTYDDAVREAADGTVVEAPEGTVEVDGETQHVTKTPRIGRIREDGLIETVEEAAEPVVPDPFLTGYDWADGVSG